MILEHHDGFKSPIRIEVEITVIVKPISISIDRKPDGAAMAALAKELADHTDALKGAIAPTPAAG